MTMRDLMHRQATDALADPPRKCRRCPRQATTSTRGRYANLCDGCKHKAVAEWAAQKAVTEAPRRRSSEHTFPVAPNDLCANDCGRPPVGDEAFCAPCLELARMAAELPAPPTAELMRKATERLQDAEKAARDALGEYRRAKHALDRFRASLRVQHQLERQRLKRPKAHAA